MAILEEGKTVARASLQAALDAANSAARTMAYAVTMRHCLWLQLSGLSREVLQLVQDLPFEGNALLSEQMDAKPYSFKDSRATLHTLGLYTPRPPGSILDLNIPPRF